MRIGYPPDRTLICPVCLFAYRCCQNNARRLASSFECIKSEWFANPFRAWSPYNKGVAVGLAEGPVSVELW